MNVDELKRRYQLPQKKRVYPKVRDKSITEDTIPGEYVLGFGKYKGERISSIPHDYLQWIVSNVTSRPDVVELVKRYLNLEPVSPVLPMKVKKPKLSVRDPQLPVRPALRASGVEGDLLFEEYKFPVFDHPLLSSTYGGRPLGELRLRELEELLQRYPDPELRDFVACRTCSLYRYVVYDNYSKAARLDVSTLDAEGLYHYQELMDISREVQSVLDSITDQELCRAILRAPRFASVFKMTLPDAG
jgi:hypothetical protein